jgi:type II secretory pathway pseudopilin PulG
MASQPAMQLGPNHKYCTSCANILDARAAFCNRCGVPQLPPVAGPPPLAPPRRGSSAATVAIVIVVSVFGGVFILGILAAIAIPNFIRYQLRAKQEGVRAEMVAIAAAEDGLHAAGRPYLPFARPVPSRPPRRGKVPLSDEDRAVAGALGWEAPAATHARYGVAVSTDRSGNEAFSICAETDLDGDGRVAAMVLFHPGTTAGGDQLEPPIAPCTGAVLARGRSLSIGVDDPADQPIAISPANVF